MSQNYSHLSQEQRYKIEALKNARFSQTKIAEQIGVHKSTISRELKQKTALLLGLLSGIGVQNK